MTAIAIQSLTKSFGGGVPALQGLDLEIDEGCIFALVGGNGAGKTTLLRVLATLLEPTAGHVHVCGYDTVRHGNEVRRIVGYVPDSFGLYGDLKVSEYLEFFADCFGLKYASGTISELLSLVDMDHHRRAYISTLSRGMRQRLLMARALIHDPQVLLLDEPASGLDPQGRDDMLEVLRELRSLGKTIVISTHLLADINRVCTDVAVLAGGKVLLSGPTDTLMQEIQSPRRVRMEVVNDPEVARMALAALPGVRDIVAEEQSLSFTFDGSRYDLPHVLERLVTQQIRVVSFAEEQGRLEALLGHVLHSTTASGDIAS